MSHSGWNLKVSRINRNNKHRCGIKVQKKVNIKPKFFQSWGVQT